MQINTVEEETIMLQVNLHSIIEDIILRTHYVTKRSHFPIKMLNFVYECANCNRHHRGYQREFSEDACPYCLNHEVSRVKEEYKWMDYHADCLALNYKIYKKYIVNKRIQEQREFDDRSIEKFLNNF
ncbi:hypothetical protein ACH0BF_16280 [Pseudobacillus sp. 179-B 2D1 NHS]|uniref:hypothetical protein n=1 Tax=Pseudobacillus sp. 179-B 2D1 NHS TaxID=3374292 RepID=UPI0038791D4A